MSTHCEKPPEPQPTTQRRREDTAREGNPKANLKKVTASQRHRPAASAKQERYRLLSRVVNAARGSKRKIMTVLRSRTIGGAEEEAVSQEKSVSQEESIPQEERDACIQEVKAIFSGICPEYLEKEAASFKYVTEDIVQRILHLMDQGQPYTKEAKLSSRKRKRELEKAEDDEISELRRKYINPSRSHEEASQVYNMRILIHEEFPGAPTNRVIEALAMHDNIFVSAYLYIEEQLHHWVKDEGRKERIFQHQCAPPKSQDPQLLAMQIQRASVGFEREILEELRAARQIRDSVRERKQKQIRDHRERERESEARTALEAAAGGSEPVECGCCYEEFPPLHLVHCQADKPHSFCLACARKNAEHQVGLSRFELNCMSSVDECKAGFSRAERQRFLDDNLTQALDRIETEAVLRMAGIENLEHCPFCPFAAEVPPLEVDKEFRCLNPDCEIVSCRQCRLETHIPKTCQEHAKERGTVGRQKVEEAMSSALIRKCNKCSSPFIKSSGCNKIKCGRSGCRNVQCYVCGQNCDYSHFNDVSRGGAKGNCPLFDKSFDRHQNEVERAERREKKNVLKDDPSIDPESLEIKMPEEAGSAVSRSPFRDRPEMGRGLIDLERIEQIIPQPVPEAGVGVGFPFAPLPFPGPNQVPPRPQLPRRNAQNGQPAQAQDRLPANNQLDELGFLQQTLMQTGAAFAEWEEKLLQVERDRRPPRQQPVRGGHHGLGPRNLISVAGIQLIHQQQQQRLERLMQRQQQQQQQQQQWHPHQQQLPLAPQPQNLPPLDLLGPLSPEPAMDPPLLPVGPPPIVAGGSPLAPHRIVPAMGVRLCLLTGQPLDAPGPNRRQNGVDENALGSMDGRPQLP